MVSRKFSRVLKIAVVVFFVVYFLIPFLLSKSESLRDGPIIQREPETVIAQPKAAGNPHELPIFRPGQLGNFELAQPDRIGPGERGRPYAIKDRKPEQQAKRDRYGMNALISDEISLNRTVPDLRLEECKYWSYPEDLPTTSVIIVFYNEAFSVIMRTVFSVINRSPPQFLHEIVLVDDFSTLDDLKENLNEFVRKNFRKNSVKVIRNKRREGLIRARSIGAEASSGDVILFLDAHCEVGVNWLTPLLAPIKAFPKTITVPIIDGIDHESFEYRTVYRDKEQSRGIFEWGMLYKERTIPQEEKRRRSLESEPYKSPTHAGGLLAMRRDYFLEVGGYDPGLEIWGGENYELSFKVWQCGGQILWVPCSHVGHVYRGPRVQSRDDSAPQKKHMTLSNYKRVVEVWFDEFKEYFYTREPIARNVDAGDISQQLALRQKLNCRPFSWFMKEIAYDVLEDFPYPPRNIKWGMVISEETGLCLDAGSSRPPASISSYTCHNHGGNQLFRLNEEGQLGIGERCVDMDQGKMHLTFCKLGTVNGPWSYDQISLQMKHKKFGIIRCLQNMGKSMGLAVCQSNDTKQRFTWKETPV